MVNGKDELVRSFLWVSQCNQEMAGVEEKTQTEE